MAVSREIRRSSAGQRTAAAKIPPEPSVQRGKGMGRGPEHLAGEQRKRQEKQFFLLREDAIPEVQHKVMQVKEKLAAEPSLSVQQACRDVHLSRSAFYKYRDSIYPYHAQSTLWFSYQRLLVEKNRNWPEALLAVWKTYDASLTQWLQEEAGADLLQIRLQLRLARETDGERIAQRFLRLRGVRELSHEEQSVID